MVWYLLFAFGTGWLWRGLTETDKWVNYNLRSHRPPAWRPEEWARHRKFWKIDG